MGNSVKEDSPLSITASIAGILTFVVAIAAAVWFRIDTARRAEIELLALKRTLERYETEREIMEKTYHFEYRVIFYGISGISSWMDARSLKGKKIAFQSGLSFLGSADSPALGPVQSQTLSESHLLDIQLWCLFMEASRDVTTMYKLLQVNNNALYRYTTYGGPAWERHPTIFNSVWRRHPTIINQWFQLQRGYTMRWLRLKPKVEELIKRREALTSNRLLTLVLQNERHCPSFMEVSLLYDNRGHSRKKANEARDKKQREMVEDIWKMLKAKEGNVDGMQDAGVTGETILQTGFQQDQGRAHCRNCSLK